MLDTEARGEPISGLETDPRGELGPAPGDSGYRAGSRTRLGTLVSMLGRTAPLPAAEESNGLENWTVGVDASIEASEGLRDILGVGVGGGLGGAGGRTARMDSTERLSIALRERSMNSRACARVRNVDIILNAVKRNRLLFASAR